MKLLELKPLEVGKISIPIWYLIILGLGLAFYSKIDISAFLINMAVLLWTFQEMLSKQDKYTKITRNLLRTIATVFLIVTFSDLF